MKAASKYLNRCKPAMVSQSLVTLMTKVLSALSLLSPFHFQLHVSYLVIVGIHLIIHRLIIYCCHLAPPISHNNCQLCSVLSPLRPLYD